MSVAHLLSVYGSRARDIDALAAADHLVLMDVYPAGERPIEGVSSGLIESALRRRGIAAAARPRADRQGPGSIAAGPPGLRPSRDAAG